VKPLRTLLVFAGDATNLTLSYQHGWPRKIADHAGFDCVLMNLADVSLMERSRRRLVLGLKSFDVVLILHSVFSNACHLVGWPFETISKIEALKVYFIGNEYKLMPEKMAFCEGLGINLLVTQSHSIRVREIYAKRLSCDVIPIPNTGLDLDLFDSRTPPSERPIDVGYRAYDSPAYLGHNERREMHDRFLKAGKDSGLKVDLSLDPEDRFDEKGWANFLNQCRGQLGTEAGGDYFELTDATRLAVNAYLEDHPEAAVTELHDRFFANYENPVPMRIISGRNVEAAGTKTVQILLRGEYGGLFEPDTHYIPVSKDFSDIDVALQKLNDREYSEQVTENAYDLVRQELTYEKLVNRLHGAIRERC